MKRLQILAFLTVLCAGFLGRNAQAQAPVMTADTYVRPYTADFAYGSNMGYYAGSWGAWDDEGIGGLVQAAGGHSVRPFLPEYFLATWGFHVRASTFAHYTNVLGMQETVCAIGEPGPAHRDPTVYTATGNTPSKLFANLYEPIWNPDGTVNTNNYYADYVYQLIRTYGDDVRIWEVVNEPDITNALPSAWLSRAPLPGETVNTLAPIYHYIRTLRITWEVVKRYSPDDYVAPGGIGYPEYLDVLLRYTDDPNGGAVSAAYPAAGGAYFDVLSYHVYPSYRLRYWSNAVGGFVNQRTSDYAAEQVIVNKDEMQAVLDSYGYDGGAHPRKHIICTETNISRRTPSGIDAWRVGSDEMQRNFYMKTLVLAQKHGIRQLYAFSIGEAANAPAPGTPVNGYEEYNLMGLYENLTRDAPGREVLTEEGVGFKTTSQLLYGWRYDAARTAGLNLPAGIEGAAFSRQGSYSYALWAKAQTDLSETATATYDFPAAWPMAGAVRHEWDFARTGASTALTGQSVTLSAAPSFFAEGPLASIVASGPTTLCQGETVTLTAMGGTSHLWSTGATTSTITVGTAGAYSVTVTDGAGISTTSAATVVTMNPPQTAAIAYPGSTFCLSGVNPVPTVTGATGGVFSGSATQLVVDPLTGAVDLTASTAGTYVVTYTTPGPCPGTTTDQVTLTNAPLASFAYTPNGPVCANSAGTLTPALTAGARAGTFSATPAGLTINAATGVVNPATSQAGTYTITNTLAPSGVCAATVATATLTLGAPPTASISANRATTLCEGETVTLTATGGDSYLWSTGATTSSITVSTSGSYSVTATNVAGCEAVSAATTVTVNPQQSADFAYSGGTFCLSGASPVPTVTGATGGAFSVTPAGLTLNALSGQITLGASLPGTYTVTYATPGPCPNTATQQVTVTTAPLADFSYASTSTVCAGGVGTLSPTLTTGASAGTFSSRAGLALDPTSGTIDLASSTAGTYTVTNTITASGLCAASSATATVTISAAPVAALAAGGPTTFCQGGSVTLTATGGGADYQFLYNGQPISGATSNTYQATQAGDYAVRVTNAAGCEATSAATTVAVAPQQSAAFTYSGGTFCLSGTNPRPTVTGTPGGTFSSASGLRVNRTTGALNLTASIAGTYTVTYTTPGPCPSIATQTVTLTSAPLAGFSYAVNGPRCAGSVGTLTPTLAAGATIGAFSVSPAGLGFDAITGVVDLSSSQPGTYTITNILVASGGCAPVTAAVTLTVAAPPMAAITANRSTMLCQGETVRLTATGGTSYVWSTGATTSTITVGTSGAYSVTARNAAGCTETSPVTTVTVNPQQSAAFAYAGSTFCSSGSNPSPNVTGTAGGVFSSSASGLSLNATTGTINLTASTAGTYSVTYTTPGPCPATTTRTVTLTTAPTAAFTYAPAGPVCAGSAGATLMPTFAAGASAGAFSASPAGLSINASTGLVNLATTQPGTYTITNSMAASGGCPVVTAATSLTVGARPTAAISAGGPTSFCQGGSVTLTATGGTSYQWSNGATTPTITVSTSGSYSVTTTNAAGCSAASTAISVSVLPRASAAFTYGGGSTTAFCLSSGAMPMPTISGTPGGTFSATPAGLSFNPQTGRLNLAASAAGTYQVQYAVGSACPASSTVAITLAPSVQAAFSYPTPVSCAGVTGTVTPSLASGSALGTFSATPGGLTLNPVTGIIALATSLPGTYTITNAVAGVGTCPASTATSTLTLVTLPTVAIRGLNLQYCAADSPVTLDGTVNGTGGLGSFTIDGQPATVFDPAALGVGPHVVVFTGSVNAGCESTVSRTVTVLATPPTPTITVTPQSSGLILLTSSQPIGNQWFRNGALIAGATGQTYPVTTSAQNGVYTVQCVRAGCPSGISSPQTVTIIVAGTTAARDAFRVELYPNPTQDGYVTLALPTATEDAPVRVYDAVGREVIRTAWHPGAAGGEHGLDLRALPVGVYSVRVLTPAGWVTRRLARD